MDIMIEEGNMTNIYICLRVVKVKRFSNSYSYNYTPSI